MQVTWEYHKLLKRFRKQARMTQEEVAEKLNLTQSTVSKLESGRCIIDIHTFMNWIRATNSEVQAAAALFGADVINNAIQLMQMVPMFVMWI